MWKPSVVGLSPELGATTLDRRFRADGSTQDSGYDPTTGIFDCKLCAPVVPL